MRFFAVALIFFGATASPGQTPEVPHKMQFAGMTLTIRDDARREIQTDVDALTKYPKYFNVKVERARTYFPIIEKIFAEERLPDDFKFLALQESALISDAVSVSDAVGFWQFKDFTAMEMGLRVDKEIDERMNLVSSSHAAARYLKQNNYMFNNWVYALQSYQMGAGGVQRAVGDQHNGAKHMEITSETYWYVKKYLAHKVAFEKALEGEAQIKVVAFETGNGKSLSDIADEVSVEVDKLKEFNKWVKKESVPADKTYTVLVPAGDVSDFTKLTIAASSTSKNDTKSLASTKPLATKPPEKLEEIFVNDIPVVRARKGESLTALADRAQIDLTSFLKYNDISIDHMLKPNALYFLEKKRTKSQSEFYKAEDNENVWSISQHTGVQLKRLKKYNDLADDQSVILGTVIWLNGPRPKSEAMPATDVVALVDKEEEFDWTEKTEIIGLPAKVSLKNPPNVSGASTTPNNVIASVDNQSVDYTVKQGETLYSIAKGNQIEVVNLLTWNDLSIGDGLKPGQVLKLYDPHTVPAAQTQELTNTVEETPPMAFQEQIHEVQPTDTLYSVAKKYGVTIKDLMDWNNKADLALTVGEKLRVRQK